MSSASTFTALPWLSGTVTTPNVELKSIAGFYSDHFPCISPNCCKNTWPSSPISFLGPCRAFESSIKLRFCLVVSSFRASIISFATSTGEFSELIGQAQPLAQANSEHLPFMYRSIETTQVLGAHPLFSRKTSCLVLACCADDQEWEMAQCYGL